MDFSNKWLLDTRNKLAEISGEFDSCAAIDGAKLTPQEREKFRKHLGVVIKQIDKEWLKWFKQNKKKTKK